MVVRTPENLCVICGNTIPEGKQYCPICGSSEGDCFEKAMSRPIPAQPDFKVNDAAEQAFRQGYEAGTRDSDRVRELLGKAMKLVRKSCSCCDVKMLSDKCKGRANPETCFRWKYYEEAEQLINKAAEKR